MLFPGRNFPFCYTQTNFSGFKKWKGKENKTRKEKKKSSVHFHTSSTSILISCLPFHNFPSFLLHLPFFCLNFPGKSTKNPGEKCQGSTLPLSPACYATVLAFLGEILASIANYQLLVLSRRYKCVGNIDQMGKSSVGLFISALFFYSVGPGFDSRLGHKELWIYLALVCLVIITDKSKWGGWRSVCYNLVAGVVPWVS